MSPSLLSALTGALRQLLLQRRDARFPENLEEDGITGRVDGFFHCVHERNGIISIDPKWGELHSAAWAGDGKAFFATAYQLDFYNLLHIAMSGMVEILVRKGKAQLLYQPVPSPDGRYLAFEAHTWDSNVWVMENF